MDEKKREEATGSKGPSPSSKSAKISKESGGSVKETGPKEKVLY